MSIKAAPQEALIDNSLGHYVVLGVPDAVSDEYVVVPMSRAHLRYLTREQFAREFPAQALSEHFQL